MNEPKPTSSESLVIAHRGACGYLPEHTLQAATLAYGMGAHFVEQDVVLTKDDHPIVLHDIHLDTVTDVARLYPDRCRDDQRYYAIDFTLKEIKRLKAHERIDLKTGTAIFPRRFPVHSGSFQVPTLAEEIELVQGLNNSTGRSVGIYPEIKAPAWHTTQNKDISAIVVRTLARYGYREKSDNAFLQCFDSRELQRICNELGCQLRLIQLVGVNDWNESADDFDQMRTARGLQQVALYADGIGPWLPHVVSGQPDGIVSRVTPLVQQAHDCGLLVHPFTFRADQLPSYVSSFEELLEVFASDANVDGFFTDFPDRVARFLMA